MPNKDTNVHDISDLPKDAPRNDDAVEETDNPTPSRVKQFFHEKKNLFIGIGVGAAAALGTVAAVKAASEEDEETVETTVPEA